MVMLNVYCRLVVCSAYVLAMHFVAVHEMVSPLPKLLIDCQHPCRVIDADVDVVTGSRHGARAVAWPMGTGALHLPPWSSMGRPS